MKKICLLVDDSSVVRKICRRIVTDLGFEAIEACDGKDALEKCEEQIPDVILLDWNMPVMDGMEFLKAYRNKQKENNTIVIFCTTENDITKIMTAIEAGANEYIMKPFDADIIKGKFEQMGLMDN
ncbi:MAG: response regulator [Rickettsiales bacterium]|nr:response regulator [Pseudomonadota bacterium]MDA0966534.1 response regulator [Pseudomonadota bacterium]MDG4543396.1 response regulator [Rickettsiales bacterium]MDG4546638.1 response regulator [Rickettsiales bacterium]MDG4548111.1 response regulator [Rickettsiales bacterium]